MVALSSTERAAAEHESLAVLSPRNTESRR
jgi:hypothetical protein